MVDFSGVSLPFGVGDLLSAAMDLLGVFGPFILLGLSIYFMPLIRSLIFKAIGDKESEDADYYKYAMRRNKFKVGMHRAKGRVTGRY